MSVRTTKSDLNFFRNDSTNDQVVKENLNEFEKLKTRDPAFLKQLFIEINPRLLRMMAGKNISDDLAEEILHECWDTFFAQLEKFEGRSKISTFMFGILINKIRENRRRLNKLDFEEDSEKIFQSSFTQDGWWVKSPEDPYQIMANQQLGTAIQDCLKGLTDPQRTAFLLIESEGESAQNVCNILGLTVSHLRVLIYRAKDKLRACLEGQFNI